MSDDASSMPAEPPWVVPERSELGNQTPRVPWLSRGPGPMLRSMLLIVTLAVLLVGGGVAAWVGYSMRKAAAEGALPAQTRALEYVARSLAFRVEQQQKPLPILAAVLAEHMHEPREALEALLLQPSSMARQFDQLQLADGKGQLLLSLQEGQSRPLTQLAEPVRDALKRGLAEGKPLVQSAVRSSDAGLQLEFQSVVPIRDAQGRLLGVLGASHRAAMPALLPLEDEQAGVAGDMFLFDKDARLLAEGYKGQWQAAGGDGAAFEGLDPVWLRSAQAGTLSERRGSKLWSVVPLPWTQWALLRVSDVQEWVPGFGAHLIWTLAAVLLLTVVALGIVLTLIAHPLTALFRKAERAAKRGVLGEVDPKVYGANWWRRLSEHDWGEAQVLRTALQALGRSREGHSEQEQQLQLQLQTLMDYAPVGLVVTRGQRVLRVGMQAARMLGYQPREMQDLPVRALCATGPGYEELVARVSRDLDIYGQFDSEVCFVRKDARQVWVRIHGQSMQRMSRSWGVSSQEGDEEDYLVWEVEDVTTQRLMREQSSWKAMHDPLTRLPNRAAFAMRLKEWLQECGSSANLAAAAGMDAEDATEARLKTHGVILYVDLDHFSQVNRQGGREVGDEVLGHIARLIESSLRPHGWVARVGGDEFAVLMPGVNREQGMRHAQLLCMAIQDWEGSYQGQRYMLSASIGMLVLDACYHSVATAFKGADMACYAAKRKGRNRVEVITAAA